MQLEAGLALTDTGLFHAMAPERAHRGIAVAALVSRAGGAFAARWRRARGCRVGAHEGRRFRRGLSGRLCDRFGFRRLARHGGCRRCGRMVTGAKNSGEHHGAGEATDFHGVGP